MILYRRGLPIIEQEELAKFFKIHVPLSAKKFFNTTLTTRKKSEDGIQTIESEGRVNRFFKKYKFPLIAKAVRASEISDLEKFIENNLRKSNDLWVEYKSDRIHGEHFIHDNVIESMERGKKEMLVTVVDPYGEYRTRNKLLLSVLQDAINENEFGRETGFLVVSKK